ncbi:very-long-chain 3-oxoacyl-CoA reductase 1-like [Corylus avellana]|uniref:very-long-chain 3-oxoacyl-CoA reductase 1-like n=1 Tax=Corylus avellana TaxID=13451 RepID=UPI001E230518|nr:very-long-chain 3-oxoacyl-CoA reductase 1-like [Corylus avellana]
MELQDLILIAATSLGLLSLCKASINFLKWVWVMFFRPSKNLKEYGSWAMITGSTDGIGKALAFELGSKGFNLLLVGRSPSKLEATSKEINEKYGGKVETKSIVIDFAKSSGEEICKMIEGGIRGLDVGILVNNAGMAYPYVMFFHEVELELMESLVKVNIDAATWVTRAVLPGMLKKKKGAIINIGSASSLSSYPLGVVYGATKAYLAMFSRCIGLEYRQQGIDIQCQIPLYVATKMIRGLKASRILVPSPEMYSKASLRWIGYEHICIPYWIHSVQWFVMHGLPEALLNWCIFEYFLSVRKRILLKKMKRVKQ